MQYDINNCYIDTSSSVTAYFECGSGKPVVFIQGNTARKEEWISVCRGLQEEFHCFAYDMIGHGKTKMTVSAAQLDKYCMADQLHEFLEALHLTDVILVGHSLGAEALLGYVDKYGTQYCRGLLPYESNPCKFDKEDWPYGVKGLDINNKVALMKADFRGYYTNFYGAVFPEKKATLPQEEYEAEVKAWLDRIDPDVNIRIFETGFVDWRPAIDKIDVPCGYIYSVPGSVNVPEIADYFEEHVPVKPFVRFPVKGTSHCIHLDDPDAIIQAVKSFDQAIQTSGNMTEDGT